MDRSNKKFLIVYKGITANTSAIWQHAAHTTDQLTSPSCQQKPHKKQNKNTKNIEEFSLKKKKKKFRRMDQQAGKKYRTERVTG